MERSSSRAREGERGKGDRRMRGERRGGRKQGGEKEELKKRNGGVVEYIKSGKETVRKR